MVAKGRVTPPRVVLDTNTVVSALLFGSGRLAWLRLAWQAGQFIPLLGHETAAELIRVLGYPRVVPRLAARGLDPVAVLMEFDQLTRIVAVAPAASCLCADADDQHFVDLAVHHGALLLSKDAAVLALLRPMRALGADASAAWSGE